MGGKLKLDIILNILHAMTQLPTCTYFDKIQMGAIIWPFIQAVNFKYVPARLRTIFVAIFSFFWTTGLAAIKHNNHDSHSVDNIVGNKG